MKKIVIIMILLPWLIFSAAAEELDTGAVLKQIDEMGNFTSKDFSCEYTMVSEKPGEERSVTEALMFRRDASDQFVMLIKKPDVQRGQGYLQVDDNVWFYDPESRKFEHSSLSENITSSDTKNSDLNRGSLNEDYDVVRYEEGKLGNFDVWIMYLKAKTDEVSYDTMKIWVRKDVTIILKSEEYGFSGNLMRTSGYFNYIRIEEKLIPSKILFLDNLNIGEKTQVSMKNVSVKTLPDYIFTKSYLERVNK